MAEQNDFTTSRVPESATVGGLGIMGVVVGLGITLPIFFVGANVALSIGFQEALFVFFFVAVALSLMTTVTSIIGRRCRLSTYMILHFSFGKTGVKLVNLLVAVSMIGWYAVTIELFGQAIADALNQLLSVHIPLSILIVIGSILMTLTAVFGFKTIEKFSNIAVPFLILFVMYILYVTLQGESTWDTIWFSGGNASMSMIEAISIVTGTSVLVPVFMPDFTRFARKDKDALMSVLGLAMGFPLVLLAGAAPAIITGEEDIMKIMIGLNLTLPALFILVFSTWTTNTINLYSTILIFSTIQKKWKFWVIGVVSSILATTLAILGFSTYFITFLNFFSLVIPSLSSIFILHYFFVKKGDYNPDDIDALPAYDWKALTAWIASSLVAVATYNELFQLTTIPFIDAFLAGLVFYGVILKLSNKKKITWTP
ncbi:MAG: cytosine permease [Chitinophagales bacterium]